MNPVANTLTASQYDALLFERRAFFGEEGYFNVGMRRGETKLSQPEACRALVEHLARWIPEDAGLILDVGCGCGASTRDLSRLRPECRLAAINYSLRQTKSVLANCPSAHAIVADGTRLPLPDGSAGAIISVEAALHFDTRASFLHECARCLRPDGVLVLSDILIAEDWPGKFTIPPANRSLTLAGYVDLLLSAGFGKLILEDALEECWIRYSDAQFEWALRSPALSETERRAYVESAPKLRSTVKHYPLLRAIRL